jgi:hypothetical protein
MAERDPNPKCTAVTMTIPEVKRLAGRLLAVGQAVPADVSGQQGDLRLAAKALLAMTRSYNRYDVLTLDCPQSL